MENVAAGKLATLISRWPSMASTEMGMHRATRAATASSKVHLSHMMNDGP